ncbi:MAG: thymidine phosphorylase [Firmicutes bacterium]|nr:thymidine phosphorylase [Bacillota bacterium]
MEMYDIIKTKRDKGILTEEQLEYVANGCADGSIPDYQLSALLMAMFINGLNHDETVSLTKAMKDSGETLDLSAISGIKVDKHSTGGVGDKTTLIATPLAAAMGVPVAKMSGRGLGFTGGTIDKLESIPGYRTSISTEEFINLVNTNGISVIGQTAEVATADKVLYGLRDVTATVDNMSLITSSIMSKKLALGSDAILLDVKCGSAAFMNSEEEARELGQMMYEIGLSFGKKVACIISRMDEPLGMAVGNALEVKEAIETLRGNGPEDLTRLCIELAGMMIYMSEKAATFEEGKAGAEAALKDGSGLGKLRDLIRGQGGDESIIDDPGKLPDAAFSKELVCGCDGYVNRVDGMTIGTASMHSGAGRREKGDEIDSGAGIVLAKKSGDSVKKGDVLCTVYSNDEARLLDALEEAAKAYEIADSKPEKASIIIDRIGI